MAKIALVSMVVLFIGIGFALARQTAHTWPEDCIKKWQGCRLLNAECDCGSLEACQDPYPYKNKRQCLKDLRGEFNKCKRSPCLHGDCLQVRINSKRKYQCACAGSGYYGKTCQHQCPEITDLPLPKKFPTDCIY